MPVFSQEGRQVAPISALPHPPAHHPRISATVARLARAKPWRLPMKSILFTAAATMALAAPAAAQSAPSWTGFYVGGRVGYVASPLKTNQSVLFDKNLDGSFGDTVTTAAGANAFSPGFCNGVAS